MTKDLNYNSRLRLLLASRRRRHRKVFVCAKFEIFIMSEISAAARAY